jgi:hypothetical protein
MVKRRYFARSLRDQRGATTTLKVICALGDAPALVYRHIAGQERTASLGGNAEPVCRGNPPAPMPRWEDIGGGLRSFEGSAAS